MSTDEMSPLAMHYAEDHGVRRADNGAEGDIQVALDVAQGDLDGLDRASLPTHLAVLAEEVTRLRHLLLLPGEDETPAGPVSNAMLVNALIEAEKATLALDTLSGYWVTSASSSVARISYYLREVLGVPEPGPAQ